MALDQLQSCVQVFATPWTVARLLCPRDAPGKNTGVGCHFLLQGVLPTQGSSPSLLCLLHSLLMGHQGSSQVLISSLLFNPNNKSPANHCIFSHYYRCCSSCVPRDQGWRRNPLRHSSFKASACGQPL